MRFDTWMGAAAPALTRREARDLRERLVSTRLAVSYLLAARGLVRGPSSYKTIAQELRRKRRRRHLDDYEHGSYVIEDLEEWACLET